MLVVALPAHFHHQKNMETTLKQLAESWRAKATRIESLYGARHPKAVEHITAALETCAEELEAAIEAQPEKKP